DIGVLDHALVDMAPGSAAIAGLPSQVPGPGVDGVGILGIDGDGFNIVNVQVSGGNLLPVLAAVGAAEDAIERAGHEGFGIGGSKGHGANRFAVHVGNGFPGFSGIVGAEQIARALVLYAPCGGEDCVRVLGIDYEVVDDVIIAAAQVSKAGP